MIQDDVPLIASEQGDTADLKMRLWWITMIRGVAALGLGIGLFAWPESTLDSLLRFMALYWLSSGLMSLMRAIRGDRLGRGFFFITGMVGILGGLFVLLHSLFEATVSFTLLATMFGTIAILTGLPHMLAGFRTSAAGREWSWGSLFLGIIEVVMGLIVIVSTGTPSRITFTVASIWLGADRRRGSDCRLDPVAEKVESDAESSPARYLLIHIHQITEGGVTS